ncbi:AraC family transcriptional regulator [Paenibacillus albidus]|uniref:AraC family transcriptional regulator n=1 Tax=Paenibacillus albidus TaxID=2041023 RepID=A0A917CM99_9BACL|nr:response regulator [Paenibacillus albidus]GGF90301.1 AraC family transcriptional regulator [Paenibacillus albidus]
MSINLLLVDDEAVDLEWMRRRMLASGLNINVVGTASSGFGALKIMEETQVDIILSDIRMPIMTGTEFARKAKALSPKTKIVFISGHEDFSYAKEAIEINASGYLLKPVQDKDLYEMMGTLCAKMEQEREQDRSFSEALSLVNKELLLRWFDEGSPDSAEPHLHSILTPFLQKGAAAAIVEIDDLEWKMRDLSEEDTHGITRQIVAVIKTFVEEAKLGTWIAVHHTRFVILSSLPQDSFLSLLEELIRKVADSSPCTVTVGVGRYAAEEAGLHESYRQAQAALSAKWLLGKNRLIRDTTQSSPRGTSGPQIELTVDRLLEAIIQYDLVSIDDHLLELFTKDLPATGRKEVYELIVRITSKLHADLQQQNENLYELLQWESHQPDILFQFETIHDILSWMRRRFFELSELLYVKRQRQKRKLIDEIIRYVEENLEKKITLKEVAAHFDFTPNYLGYLFKEEYGQPFSEYVNERKTSRVSELLSDPTLKIYEIAERMGYKNIIYFNRQFKQTTGMTPGEYRKKHKI